MAFQNPFRPSKTALVERRIQLVQSLLSHGRVQEADAEIRQVIETSRTSLGAEHQLTVTARVVHSATLYVAGRYAECEETARALAADRAHLRGDHLALAALSHAAQAVSAQGGHAEALRQQDELLPYFIRIHGQEHPLTLKLRSDRAQTLGYLARYEESEAESRSLIALAGQGKEPSHRMLSLSARNALSYAQSGSSRFTEAETTAREALAGAQGEDRFTSVLRLALIRALNGQQRYEEALTELAALPELQTPAETGTRELARATALRGQGRRTEAETEARSALAAITRALGPEHRRAQEAQDLLGTLADD
ncbi:tetratricopeptide repeat protein [Streptomyces sp. NBC_01304]|uniref:tetratricopeptide repeat protein n=1 Tax=Streptomyces sp. NBC_01304 TaxID=2903818 RepID=UPI002E1248EB|nr:tetratricopeptide repeat protein [Streptomyces sp. NBC_01304]